MDSKVSDAVLNRKAVNELTRFNNASSRIESAADESKAKELLKALHQRGITLMPDVMYFDVKCNFSQRGVSVH